MTGVYRIPTRKVFKKIRADKGTTWEQVYGSEKCIRCREHFKESDPYIVVVHYKPTAGGKGNTMPVHKYMHAEECEEKVVKKRVIAKPRVKKGKAKVKKSAKVPDRSRKPKSV
jgi:hypothetical protein